MEVVWVGRWDRGARGPDRPEQGGWIRRPERAGCWWAGEEAGRWVTRRIVISQEYKTTNKLLRTVKHEDTARELRPLQLKQLVMEYFLYNIITFTRVGKVLIRGCWIICIQDELLIVHKGTNNKQTNKRCCSELKSSNVTHCTREVGWSLLLMIEVSAGLEGRKDTAEFFIFWE